MATGPYDVFISYHSKPPVGDWVRTFFVAEFKGWLDQQFERPAEIFYDVESIRVGENWRSKLADALAASRTFIPVCSPSYFYQSRFCQWEWECYRAWRPAAVLPILYYNLKKLPADVQVIEMEDFSDLNLTFAGWRSTADYGKFQQRVRDFAERVAEQVRGAPAPPTGGFPADFKPPPMPEPPGMPSITQHRLVA